MNTPPDLDDLLETLSGRSSIQTAHDVVDVRSPARKRRNRLTKPTILEILADFEAGLSTRQLAAKYQRPRTTILSLLHREGVARSRDRITDRQILEARRLIESGISVPKAAEQVGAKYTTLGYALFPR